MSICSTLKSVNPKSSGGSAPWTPGRGPKAGPWTPPKIGSRLRARYVRSAHMFAQKKSDPSNSKKSRTCLPKKNRTPAIQKNRLALRARYVRYAHMFVCPPIINRCPLLAPPLFKSWCRHCVWVVRLHHASSMRCLDVVAFAHLMIHTTEPVCGLVKYWHPFSGLLISRKAVSLQANYVDCQITAITFSKLNTLHILFHMVLGNVLSRSNSNS